MSGFVPDQHADLSAPANVLRLLGHPVRLSICLLLLTGPKTVAFIESHLAVRQPNLSQHLAILRDAGVLGSSRKAKSVTYEITPGPMQRMLVALSEVLAPTAVAPAPAQAPLAPARPAEPAARPGSQEPRFEHEEALVFASVRYPRP